MGLNKKIATRFPAPQKAPGSRPRVVEEGLVKIRARRFRGGRPTVSFLMAEEKQSGETNSG